MTKCKAAAKPPPRLPTALQHSSIMPRPPRDSESSSCFMRPPTPTSDVGFRRPPTPPPSKRKHKLKLARGSVAKLCVAVRNVHPSEVAHLQSPHAEDGSIINPDIPEPTIQQRLMTVFLNARDKARLDNNANAKKIRPKGRKKRAKH